MFEYVLERIDRRLEAKRSASTVADLKDAAPS